MPQKIQKGGNSQKPGHTPIRHSVNTSSYVSHTSHHPVTSVRTPESAASVRMSAATTRVASNIDNENSPIGGVIKAHHHHHQPKSALNTPPKTSNVAKVQPSTSSYVASLVYGSGTSPHNTKPSPIFGSGGGSVGTHSQLNPANKKKFSYLVNNEDFPALAESLSFTVDSALSLNQVIEEKSAPVPVEPERLISPFLPSETTLNDTTQESQMNDSAQKSVFVMCTSLEEMVDGLTGVDILDQCLAEAIDAKPISAVRTDASQIIKQVRSKGASTQNRSLHSILPLLEHSCSPKQSGLPFSINAHVGPVKRVLHFHKKQSIDPPDSSQEVDKCSASDNKNNYGIKLHLLGKFNVVNHLDEYCVPLDYLNLSKLHDKTPFVCDKFSDEILLLLYYSHVGDGLQMLAAYHLYRRGWRFHAQKMNWIALNEEQFAVYISVVTNKRPNPLLSGVFWYFCLFKWRMEKMETTIDMRHFELVDVYAAFLNEATNSHRSDPLHALSTVTKRSTPVQQHIQRRPDRSYWPPRNGHGPSDTP